MMNDVAGLYSIQEAVGMQVVLGLSVDRIAKYKQGNAPVTAWRWISNQRFSKHEN